MKNSYDTNFDSPDAHFDNYNSSVMFRPKHLEIRNVMTVKIRKIHKQRDVKWSKSVEGYSCGRG
jgi:hypothetical protein